MENFSLRGLLKNLRNQYPYVHPGDVYPHGDQWEYMWNMAIREGREQIIRYIAELAGESAPISSPEPTFDHVSGPQDRGSADAYARSGPGSYPGEGSEASAGGAGGLGIEDQAER